MTSKSPLGAPLDVGSVALRNRFVATAHASGQTRDGGWGPYADSPAEPFDTAIVLLSLTELRSEPGVDQMIRR